MQLWAATANLRNHPGRCWLLWLYCICMLARIYTFAMAQPARAPVVNYAESAFGEGPQSVLFPICRVAQ